MMRLLTAVQLQPDHGLSHPPPPPPRPRQSLRSDVGIHSQEL